MRKLDDVADVISGQHVNVEHVNNAGLGDPYLTGPSDFEADKPRATKWTDHGKAFCRPGDILITVKGSGCGTMAVADQRYAISRQLMAIRPRSSHTGFLWAALSREIARLNAMSSGTIPGLTKVQILGIPIPDFPYEAEQWIGNIDDLWARVHHNIRSLITAKREFKRGLMQELLTGRRRFPEFGPKAATIDQPPAGWTETTLGELADIRVSNVDKHTRAEHNSVRLCNYMDVWTRPYIMADQEFMTSTASPREIERFSLRTGDVLLTKDSETREEIAESSVVLSAGADLVLGYHLALVRPNPELVDGRFLAAQLRVPRFRQHFVRSAQGATRYGLTIAALKRAPVWIPPIEEQRRISETDLSLHREIELLEELRTQFETQKRGLLQKLLTGELTIPVPETTDQEPVHA